MQEGIVYRIFNLQLVRKKDYYGSTKNTLKYRWSRHKSDYKTRHYNYSIYEHFDNHGFDSFTIEEVERVLFQDRKELLIREQWWKDNRPCCNNVNAYGCDLEKRKARQKEYNKRPERKARQKECAQCPERKARQKEYNKRPERKARAAEHIECECGVSIRRQGIARHRKTKKHIKSN